MMENSSDMIKMGKPRNICGCKHLVPVSFPLESSRLSIAGTNASIIPSSVEVINITVKHPQMTKLQLLISAITFSPPG
jgi:hypothetical protein